MLVVSVFFLRCQKKTTQLQLAAQDLQGLREEGESLQV